MENVPKKIYLQVDGGHPTTDESTTDWNDLFHGSITWSDHRVYDSDIEYVNIEESKEIAKQLIRDEIKRLEQIRYIDGTESPMKLHRVVEQIYSCRSVLMLLNCEKPEE